MRIDDLRAARDEELTADCVVIGTGPAGMTVARELAGGARRVLLLESGGPERHPDADALNEIESVGAARVMDQWLVRNRILGGTSHTWSGRAVVLDPIDFAERPWVPHSGWPIRRADLEPYFARAQPHLGAPVADNDDAAFVAMVNRGQPAQDPGRLVPYAWAQSQDAASPRQPMRFGPRAAAEDMPGVRCLVHATVTRIEADRDGVRRLQVVDATGARRSVRAEVVVLAAGAIENARLLLVSGIGAEHDQVGRYLTDHLRGPVATFPRNAHAALQRVFGNRVLRGGAEATPGWALTPEVQEREGLTNAAVWALPVIAASDPYAVVRQGKRKPAGALRAAALHAPTLAAALVRLRLQHRVPVQRLDRLDLHAIVEQVPDPDSRVLLADRRDAHGVPTTRIDWRVGETEARSARRVTALAIGALAAARLPLPRPLPVLAEDAPFDLPDVAHPMGTTRMSAAPEDGVVDEQCRVHGVPDLFVAGSSVFPTGGHANPTMTIVALAVRTADAVRERLRSGRVAEG